jgi:hypothetical protein
VSAQKTVTQDQDFPRGWRFDEDGLEVEGRYVKADVGRTANGSAPIIVLDVDGEERSVWCFHTALRNRIADELATRVAGDFNPGELILIRQGEKKTGANDRAYVSYTVRFPEAPKRNARAIFKADPIDEPPTAVESGPDEGDIPF